ncbi:MAG: EAL domain-containing protein [Betaproteobacteria bacterium]|nr:EAL domain-containing protein [Betaproteobacteria bacterium]
MEIRSSTGREARNLRVFVGGRRQIRQHRMPSRRATVCLPLSPRDYTRGEKFVFYAPEMNAKVAETLALENKLRIAVDVSTLQAIRGLDVRISVDDFGTGYSSLAYVASLPIHALMIDRSFVVGMTQNQESLAIVSSAISLAHTLKLTVIAEGVETDEQATQLGKLTRTT